MAPATAAYYYYVYRNDPEKKVPSPRNRFTHPHRVYTQEQVENLIGYIVDDRMSIPKASAKANMACESGRKYYLRYLKDPDHTITAPLSRQHYTLYQKNEVTGYIVNDKISIKAASKKAKMGADSGRKYYHKYFKDQHPDIPTPSHIVPNRERYTQEQIKEAILSMTSCQ